MVTNLEIWGLLKTHDFKGKNYKVTALNSGSFQVLAPTHHTPSHTAGSSACMSAVACRSQGGQRGPCPANTRNLCSDADCCIWSQRCSQRQVAIVVTLSPIVANPSPRSWSDLKGISKVSALLSPLFLFSPFMNQTLKTRTLKNNCENQKVTVRAQGKSQKRPQKLLILHLMLMAWQRKPTTIILKSQKNKTKNQTPPPSKPWGRGRIWFPELPRY